MDRIDNPIVENSLMGPIVNPEFPNAEDVWKSSFRNDNSGWVAIIKMNKIRKVKNDKAEITKAFCTCNELIVLPQIEISFLPWIILAIERIVIATVVSFIPPATDVGAPPISIVIDVYNWVTRCVFEKSINVNPEVWDELEVNPEIKILFRRLVLPKVRWLLNSVKKIWMNQSKIIVITVA